MARCATIKANGQRCRAQAITGNEFCYVHAPELAETRKRNNRKGGQRGGRGRPKNRTELVHKVADTMISKLLKEEIDPSVAAVIIQAGNLKLRAALADLKIEQQQELVERLEELESLIEKSKGGRQWGSRTG